MSVDFSILKWPVVGGGEPLGTLARVSARVERALGLTIHAAGAITCGDWILEYRAIIEDGAVAILRCSPRSCRNGTPQVAGDWIDLLRDLASALGATVLDEQMGVPIGDDDDDVPAPARADDFVIELLPASGRDGDLGDARAIWRDLEARLGITALHPHTAGDRWHLRVVGVTVGPVRRLELHLSWQDVAARTTALERCATINDGVGWVAFDPERDDVFPLDWFLAPS